MAFQKLKLGMVGAGFVSHFHARAIQQVRTVEIAGITSRTPERAQQLAQFIHRQGLGEAKVFGTVEEMVPHVDAVALFCPNFVRLEVMEKVVNAIEKGATLKGIICEKPLARNLPEANRMVELAEQVGLKTAYFENQIFMKPIQVQREQLAPQQKTMGPLVLTRTAEEHGGPHEGWFWDPTLQGGGVLNDMGCHSIAVGWYLLTPLGKPPRFLQPVRVQADCALLKWGQPHWRKQLQEKYGVDYTRTPAEDFATGMVTFRNPETGQWVKSQFTDSWMFEKQGLRLFMDGMGPGYAFEVNTLNSPLQIFIGDVAAEAVADAESALEKATASRGLLAVQYNEPDLYGYTDEMEDAARAFLAGQDALLDWHYGREIVRLVMAAYLSAERQQTVDLTDPQTRQELERYIPLIQQGKGADLLGVR